MAISLGHLEVYLKWEKLDSDIVLIMHGEDNEIEIQLEFNNKRENELQKGIKSSLSYLTSD